MRYRPKDRIVEAIQYNGSNFEQVKAWYAEHLMQPHEREPEIYENDSYGGYTSELVFNFDNMEWTVEPGYWIVLALRSNSIGIWSDHLFQQDYEEMP